MQITLFKANCLCNAKNCYYSDKAVVTNAEELIEAVKFDHVCAEYQKNYRSVGNFMESDVIVMDLDNDHTENPAEWVTPAKLDEMMPDISYALAPSRHHMLPKDGKAARPKYHVYFPIDKCTDAETYAAIKRAIHKAYPVFDGNALDAARFIFGADCTEAEWHDGWMTIDYEVQIEEEEEDTGTGGVIVAGQRNNTLSRFAGRIVKRYGATDKAYKIFLEEAEKCDPPLSDEELTTIWHSAVKFGKKIQGQDGYVPPDDYNDDFGGDGQSLKPEDYSDIGQAKVLAREYGEELLYTNATDYLRFDGEVWVENKQLAVGAMEEFLDLQLQDAMDEVERAKKLLVAKGVPEEAVKGNVKKLEKEITGDQIPAYFMLLAAQSYLGFVLKRRDMKYVTSTLNAAKPMLSAEVDEFDSDENLLNTPYATYNLTLGLAGEQPHDPRNKITKITECSPGDQGMDIWLEALETFFCGDSELIEYVQNVIGLAAIGKVYEEFIIIAYGDGANGKSTFWNTIARVLGTYSGKISSDILTMANKVNAQPEMAELKGKRLIIASEMQEGMRLNTAMVKQLCSTDEIQACKKYKDPFHFVPSHQVVLYTNHLPKVGANDDGIWRRLKVIPFNAKIKGNSDIKNYADYLYEKAAPAIMKWIIEGAEKVSKANHKVQDPKVVKDAVEAYREDNDWLGHFIAECCDVGDGLEEKSGEFYQQYRAYCIQNGEYVRSTTDFYSAIDKAGYRRHKTNKGVMVHGVKLKTGSDFI